MSQAATAAAMTPEERDQDFYGFIDASMKQKINPFKYTGKFDGETKTVYYLGKMDMTKSEVKARRKKIMEKVYCEWNCNYCRDYIGKVCLYFDQNGPIVFRGVKTSEQDSCCIPCIEDHSKHQMRTKARIEAQKMFKFANSPVNPWDQYGNFTPDRNMYNWHPVLLDWVSYPHAGETDAVFEKTLFTRGCHHGKDESGSSFKHYTYCQPDDIVPLEADLVKRYAPSLKEFTPLFLQMLSRFKDMRGLEDSLRLLLKLIDESAHASAIKNSVLWFVDIINLINTKYDGHLLNQMPVSDRIHIITTAIFKTRPEEGTDGMVIHWYSQISKNVLDLLEKARDETSMKTMLEERFSPVQYRRKTAPPKKHHLEKGISIFGNMKNTLMTTGQLSKFPGAHFIRGTSPEDDGTTDAMRAMMEMGRQIKKKDKYGSFANRSEKGRKVEESLNPTTLNELIHMIKSGKIHKLEANTNYGTPMVVVDTNLDPSLLQVEHLFGVYAGTFSGKAYFTNAGYYYPDGYTDIDMVYDCNLSGSRVHNIMFVPKNARAEYIAKPVPWNTTFPEFLSTKGYHHSATFEGFVNTTKIITPESPENFAYGLSASVTKPTTGELGIALRFKINGNHKVFTINKY